MKKFTHEAIFCIVNSGFSDEAMDAAKACGARGGTVINARGTASTETEKHFNITIQPEKEIVMIIVEKSLKDTILHALYQKVGLNTEGQGIAFSVPVDKAVGLAEARVDVKTEAKADTVQ